jgi:hypothetical protein
MAARLNPFNQETVKQKIQATQLVKRLQDHVLGEVEMSQSQIDAAKFLLNKRLSNAPTEVKQELTGKDGNPLSTVNKIQIEFVDTKA